MLNVFRVHEIPGTDQYIDFHFNRFGKVEKSFRYDLNGLIESIYFHVNGEVAEITDQSGFVICENRMTTLKDLPVLKLR